MHEHAWVVVFVGSMSATTMQRRVVRAGQGPQLSDRGHIASAEFGTAEGQPGGTVEGSSISGVKGVLISTSCAANTGSAAQVVHNSTCAHCNGSRVAW